MIYKYLYGGLFVAILSGIAYFYYTNTQSRIELLMAQTTELSIQLQRSEQQLTLAFEQAQRLEDTNTQLIVDLQTAERRVTDLRRTLAEHDLESLARIRPGLIQNTINDATVEVLRQLEEISR